MLAYSLKVELFRSYAPTQVNREMNYLKVIEKNSVDEYALNNLNKTLSLTAEQTGHLVLCTINDYLVFKGTIF